jgi:hypothetical protein
MKQKRSVTADLVFALALAVTSASATAHAQDKDKPRPSEADIFGTPAAPASGTPAAPASGTPAKPAGADAPAKPTPFEGPAPSAAGPEAPKPEGDATPAGPPAADTAPATPGTPSAESSRDSDLMGDPAAGPRLSEETAPSDPLKLGGMFYLRTQTSARQGDTPDDWSLSAPALLDAYMDARPNERVRGLVLARMSFDPTLPSGTTTTAAQQGMLGNDGSSGAANMAGVGDLSSLFAGRSRGPNVVLDQMWLRFDLDRTVFVTAGKQHVRWGTARFWTPADFLHVRKRNPLDVFDARTGTTMVKLHLPWERTGWNFYAYGLLEGADATPRLGDVAGAARAEVVLGSTEIGAGALVQANKKPKIAFDISTGIWDLDVYGEVALRYGDEIDRVTYEPPAGGPGTTTRFTLLEQFPVTTRSGMKAQAVGGFSYSRKYNDNDVINVGFEYFYNPLGYDSPEAYPGLILPHATPLRDPATFFYLGRHYGAVSVNIPAPYDWNYTTFTLSNLGNLSDQSFIARLDYSLVLLTHLRFEAFAALHYGRNEGEFRFGVDNLTIDGRTFNIAPSLLDLGIALRVSL